MTKLRNSDITTDDVKEYLNSHDDFGLELDVYRKATQLGLITSHGGTYEDPITKKPRQFDIRAAGESGNRRIELAIECKALRRWNPLVVSRVPRAADESFHQIVVSLDAAIFRPSDGRTYPLTMPYMDKQGKSISLTEGDSVYKPGDQVGKSTNQIGRNLSGELVSGDAEVFDKWSQALGSAAELVDKARAAYETHDVEMFLTAVLPVLVVPDGTLWIADYSTDGTLTGVPVKTTTTTVFVARSYSSMFAGAHVLSHLHVFTSGAIERFMQSVATKDDQLWEQLMPEKAVIEAISEAYSED